MTDKLAELFDEHAPEEPQATPLRDANPMNFQALRRSFSTRA
jgi:hypothetical protein